MANNRHLNFPGGDIFKANDRLWFLNLANCGLTRLPEDTIKWLPRLDMLLLMDNLLDSINLTPCGTDVHLFMSLNHNLFTNFTKETIGLSCNCSVLQLVDNPFQVIDPGAMAALKVASISIGTEDLAWDIYSMDVYRDLFTGIAQSSIRNVTVNFGGEDEFWPPVDFFDPLRNKAISHLNLTGAALQMTRFIFQPMNNMTRLTITKTNMQFIEPYSFHGLSELNVLDLPYNNLFQIRFHQWKLNISKLDLSNNNFEIMSFDTFIGLDNLSLLNLSHNPYLTTIDPASFVVLFGLQHLDVSATALRLYEGHPWFHFPYLMSFSFSDRLIVREFHFFVWPQSFARSTSLKRINLRNSQLTLIELWDKSLNVSIFKGLNNLKYLDLSRNELQTLSHGLFPYLAQLQELDLKRCGIFAIDFGAFTGLRSLEILHLQDNWIISLPRGIFNTMMAHLKALNLESNRLKYLDEDLFLNTSRLANLSLSGNHFTNLNRSTFIPLHQTLKYLDLSSNPLECSCQLKWLLDWRKSSLDFRRANDTICSLASDKDFQEKPLFAIDANELCVSYVPLYCTLPVIVVGLFAIMSFVYHKRWLIKYQVFLLKLAVLGYEEVQDPREHGDYEFDLNIIFTETDQNWVTAHLIVRIEENLPQFRRIALGDDDLPLGMYYLDAVLHVIEYSFKTILLLSRAAVQDSEFMMKLRIALNHVTNTQTQSTMVIFLEDIPDQEMPHLVKLYLGEERPYMFWIKDDKAQAYFWKRLTKKLSVNLRCNDMVPPE